MNDDFIKELEGLLNRYSIDNECSTPDFILARSICGFLVNYRETLRTNMKWHGWPSLSERLGLDKPLEAEPKGEK